MHRSGWQPHEALAVCIAPALLMLFSSCITSLMALLEWLQTVEVIDPRQRDRRLPELLKQYHGARRQDRIIVFVL